MKWQMAFVAQLQGSPEDVEAMLDAAMERMLEAGVEDPAIGAALASGAISIEFVVEGADVEEIQRAGLSVLRHALQQSGNSEILGTRTDRLEPALAG